MTLVKTTVLAYFEYQMSNTYVYMSFEASYKNDALLGVRVPTVHLLLLSMTYRFHVRIRLFPDPNSALLCVTIFYFDVSPKLHYSLC